MVNSCSSGVDRGDPEVLAKAMERLDRRRHRIVWLNPHKGDDRDFRPSTLGMMVAAPHIDLLLSGHDLASLEELAECCRPCNLGGTGLGGTAIREQESTREVECRHRGRRRPDLRPGGNRRARDAVAASGGVATGIGTNLYGAQLLVVADSREDAVAAATGLFSRPRADGRAARRADRPDRGDQRGRGRGCRGIGAWNPADRGRQRPAVIRLGSLAADPFDGPRVLGGWTPSPVAAVYAVMYKPDPVAKPENYAVIYVGHADDLSAERFPFVQAPAGRVLGQPGRRKWKVYICTYEVPGGTQRAPRADIPRADRRLPAELQRPAV